VTGLLRDLLLILSPLWVFTAYVWRKDIRSLIAGKSPESR
jgi:hypothetical protein